MISVRIDLSGFSDRKLPEFKPYLERLVRLAGLAVERHGKIIAPVDTGRLRSSIFTTVKSLQAIIQPNVIYAGWASDRARDPSRRDYMLKGAEQASAEVDKIVDDAIEQFINDL